MKSFLRRIYTPKLHTTAIILCCTHSIFVWDIRGIVNMDVVRVFLDVLSVFCLVFFVLDTMYLFWREPQYRFSFRVVFDCLATVSLVFCIPFFTGSVVSELAAIPVLSKIQSLQLIRYWKLVNVAQSLLPAPVHTGETMSRMLLQDTVVFVLMFVVGYKIWSQSLWYSLSLDFSVGLVLILSRVLLFNPSGSFEELLRPINTMIEKVERIRKDPMAAANDDKERRGRDMTRINQLARLDTASGWWSRWRLRRQLVHSVDSSSVVLVEKTIEQIGELLAVGFGTAGARIVFENMQNVDTMKIHAMIPGRRIEAIFGHFCIQDFARVTSALQDKVMLFVNQICDIVHGIVDEFHGIPNRSNGDSFLVVWTNPDFAVAACIKIQIAINRSIELWEYGRLPSLIGFRVKIYMGLHRGWAIEGAIGSNLKIDSTYLSPDVNVAQMLQETNQRYSNTFLLVSKCFVKSCLVNIQKLFRQIDLDIFSLDLNICNLLTPYETEHAVITGPRSESLNINVNTKLGKARIRMDREERKRHKLSAKMDEILNRDRYFQTFCEKDDNFKSVFLKGFLNYECGEMQIARDAFRDALQIRPNDGPTQYLLTLCST